MMKDIYTFELGIKAININWDTDNEDVNLPDEIDIPDQIVCDEDLISDYISDVTGFCHYGFELNKEIF